MCLVHIISCNNSQQLNEKKLCRGQYTEWKIKNVKDYFFYIVRYTVDTYKELWLYIIPLSLSELAWVGPQLPIEFKKKRGDKKEKEREKKKNESKKL